jgi:hypothetical protein
MTGEGLLNQARRFYWSVMTADYQTPFTRKGNKGFIRDYTNIMANTSHINKLLGDKS